MGRGLPVVVRRWVTGVCLLLSCVLSGLAGNALTPSHLANSKLILEEFVKTTNNASQMWRLWGYVVHSKQLSNDRWHFQRETTLNGTWSLFLNVRLKNILCPIICLIIEQDLSKSSSGHMVTVALNIFWNSDSVCSTGWPGACCSLPWCSEYRYYKHAPPLHFNK